MTRRRALTFGEASAFVAMLISITLMLIGGADPTMVGIGAGGTVAFAIMVQVLWNARVQRDLQDEAKIQDERGSVFGTGTAPPTGPFRVEPCPGWLCTNDWCAVCQDHTCERCNRPLVEHPGNIHYTPDEAA